MRPRRLIPPDAPIIRAVVRRTVRLTPEVRRVVLGGPELAGLEFGPFTDHYVRLLFPRPGAGIGGATESAGSPGWSRFGTDTGRLPPTLALARTRLPRERRPWQRTYTVRSWDAPAAELALDIGRHGDRGIAGPWAARCAPGDPVHLVGPGGGYAPDPAADHHLFAGDAASLPAIAVALAHLPAAASARVFLQVRGSEEHQPLPTAAAATITWVHGERPDALVDAVRAEPMPSGRLDAFVHGEAHAVRAVRRFLLLDAGLPPERLSSSGYWRRGTDEDGWRAAKPAWNRALVPIR